MESKCIYWTVKQSLEGETYCQWGRWLYSAYVDCTAGLNKSCVVSFVLGIICPVVLKSNRSSPILCLPPPTRCSVRSVHHVLSRGRLVEVAVCQPRGSSHGEGGRQKPPPLRSSFTSHFSDKHLPPVVSLTSSPVFLCLIPLSNLPFSQSGLFSLRCFICFHNHWGQWGHVPTIHLFYSIWGVNWIVHHLDQIYCREVDIH